MLYPLYRYNIYASGNSLVLDWIRVVGPMRASLDLRRYWYVKCVRYTRNMHRKWSLYSDEFTALYTYVNSDLSSVTILTVRSVLTCRLGPIAGYWSLEQCT